MRSLRKGFTLAEVLLTLAIVGIVAALTIPALLNSTQQGELKSAAKKAMSSLNQAVIMGVAQNSSDPTSCTGCSGNTLAHTNALKDFFAARLNIIQNNNATADAEDGSATSKANVTTADGMIYYFFRHADGLCGTGGGTDFNNPHTAACVVEVDVNGSKGPNEFSTATSNDTGASYKDKFVFVIRANNVVPAVGDGSYGTDGGTKAIYNVAQMALK